ncbi:MAG: hypothetical protein MJ010_06090 [Paludibacteraceae bacterium]|nr:hypothetical protein [Paludibacteraceae bacterium]
MIYLIVFAILMLSMYLYFPVAERHKLLAGVNNRSSHKKPVITAAGFIFYLSYIIYVVYELINDEPVQWFWFAGLTILAIVSFIDDLNDVWFLIRLFVQIIAVSLVMCQLCFDFRIEMMGSVSQWSAAILLLIISVGLINLYNFMDGLNGMLGGVALSMAVPLLFIDLYVPSAIGFADPTLIGITILGALIFLFFNYRPQPKCFSGDVGSIVLGYMMCYFVFSLIIKTGNANYILLFAVTLMEAGLTVLQRLFAGENIFAPHRIHLFQLFCNEYYKSHRSVSAIYAGIQLVLGMGLFLFNYYSVAMYIQTIVLWLAFVGLCVAYLLVKRKKMGGHLLDNIGLFRKQQ